MTEKDHLLLTGGTGFFGKSIIRHFITNFEKNVTSFLITIITRSAENFLARHPEFAQLPWLNFHCGDILKFESLPHAVKFTHIIHAAADSTLGPLLTPLERYQQIVIGTQNMLEFARSNGVKKFLFASSGAVYGVQPQHLETLSENWHSMPDPLNPQNAYGVAKRAAEHLCSLYRDQYGLHTIVARCFSFVGQDLPLDVHFAIGNFIRDALTREQLTVAGDGSAIRGYMDQRDLARWLEVLLMHGRAGEAYNVGSNEAISIKELVHRVRDILAPSKPVVIIGNALLNVQRNRYLPNIDKAQKEFGLTLNYSLPLSLEIFR